MKEKSGNRCSSIAAWLRCILVGAPDVTRSAQQKTSGGFAFNKKFVALLESAT